MLMVSKCYFLLFHFSFNESDLTNIHFHESQLTFEPDYLLPWQRANPSTAIIANGRYLLRFRFRPLHSAVRSGTSRTQRGR